MAEVSLTKAKGGFVDFSGSPDALTFNAFVESFFRLNRRAVVFGAMSYNNFSGHDMAGSAFITSKISNLNPPFSNQPHLPFDIVEDSLTNTGTKHQDTYRLVGGFSLSVTDGFAIGARLDYTAANLAKYKDLRHKNKLMDMNLTAGFYLPLSFPNRDRERLQLAIGANYLYHRTTESVQFSTYGKNDKVYNSLISYANFMGAVEQFGSTGFTDKSREMPLVSDYNGVGVQFSLTPSTLNAHPSTLNAQRSPLNSQRSTLNPQPSTLTPQLSFFNSFIYAHRRGYYGRKSPYTITYTDHESDIFSYNAQLSASSQCGSRFSLDLSLTAENLRNDAANYRELQNEQGATYYEYYTPVKTANKLWLDGTAALTAELGRLNLNGGSRPSLSVSLPKWTFRAGLNWHRREQTAYVYPFYRRQDLSSKEPFVSLCHNMSFPRLGRASYFTFVLDFSFLKGCGLPYEDFTYQQPSDKQEQPPVMDAYLWREYLWLTAAQYCVGGSVKYSFVMPSIRLRTFVRLSLSHRKANETSEYSLGCDLTTASLAVGCEF